MATRDELQALRDNLACALNMGGLREAAQWAVGELDRLLAQTATPVAAQQRFRHPQKTAPDWSPWQPAEINPNRPSWTVDTQGYEVEYRLLFAAAPAVKVGRWKCGRCGAATGEACNANGCFANERSPES